jgi:2-keto-4-pentenoate hydratase
MATDLSTLVSEPENDTVRCAEALVHARRAAQPLREFPGSLPATLDAAYACQAAGIQRWPDTVAGWKVGWIAADEQTRVGEERLVGPVFLRHLRQVAVDAEPYTIAVYAGGFGAIEAEVAFRIARDAPTGQYDWTAEQAAAYVATAHAAVEVASSPLATINQLGPRAIVADFGNNAGLLVGPVLPGWTPARDRLLTCRTEIGGRTVGVGGAATLPGGPLAALAFALGRGARNGQPLRAGQYVTTGASTGIHEILPGESGRIVFDGVGTIELRAVARAPD